MIIASVRTAVRRTHTSTFHFGIWWPMVFLIFFYDSKFQKTFVPLFTKPGFLTREYLEGRRIRYVHPLRLYFFVSFVLLFFSIFSFKRIASNPKWFGGHVNFNDSVVKLSPKNLRLKIDSINNQLGALSKARLSLPTKLFEDLYKSRPYLFKLPAVLH